MKSLLNIFIVFFVLGWFGAYWGSMLDNHNMHYNGLPPGFIIVGTSISLVLIFIFGLMFLVVAWISSLFSQTPFKKVLASANFAAPLKEAARLMMMNILCAFVFFGFMLLARLYKIDFYWLIFWISLCSVILARSVFFIEFSGIMRWAVFLGIILPVALGIVPFFIFEEGGGFSGGSSSQTMGGGVFILLLPIFFSFMISALFFISFLLERFRLFSPLKYSAYWVSRLFMFF